MSYYAFVKEEERKVALQQKKYQIWQWTKIVGHKPEILVLHDPFNLPPVKRGKREVPSKISLETAKMLVREELIKKQGGIAMNDGNIRYHFTR